MGAVIKDPAEQLKHIIVAEGLLREHRQQVLAEIRRERPRDAAAERTARALVSILPYGSAAFVLHDPPELVDSRSPNENAELMDGVGE